MDSSVSISPTKRYRKHEELKAATANRGENRPASIDEAMSVSATEIADMTRIAPLLNKLKLEQNKSRRQFSSGQNAGLSSGGTRSTSTEAPASNSSATANSSATTSLTAAVAPAVDEQLLQSDVSRLLSNQRLIYLRTQISTYLQSYSLEVSSVIGRLNSGLAELADRKAMISDQRARTLRRQSFINLVSGGLSKIGGYSIALTGASSIPTSILEVFDGGVQVSLSAFSLKQQKDEQKLSKSRPAILNAFLSGNNISSEEFPPAVWTYLNESNTQVKDGRTRRKELIEHWEQIGRLTDSPGKKLHYFRATTLAPALNQSFHLDDLDDTVAMMSDLKSVVSGMETGLMELGETVRESYKDDPEI